MRIRLRTDVPAVGGDPVSGDRPLSGSQAELEPFEPSMVRALAQLGNRSPASQQRLPTVGSYSRMMSVSPRHPADTTDLPVVGNAPTGADIASVRDVLLVPTGEAGTFEEFQAHAPAGSPPVDLNRELHFIESLPRDEVDLVMDACTPRGHYFVAARQFGCRHALVRELDESTLTENRFNWDGDGVVNAAFILSRLVRDNAYSTQFAARVIDHADGAQQVIPGPVATEAALAYRARPGRDWLDAGEARELASLLAAFWAHEPTFPDRVVRAIRRAEDASRRPLLFQALLELVSGLEALFNTNKSQVTTQFTHRVSAAARELGITGMTKRLCRRMYDARSQATHGAEIRMFSPRPDEPPADLNDREEKNLAEVALLQDVLRACVRRAIEKPAFAAHFATAGAVRQHWPVSDGEGAQL
jgi:hypothetical protein